MTLEEAKKILKKEGFHLVLASKVINQTGAIREFEKPEVCEAIKVANANKWTVGLSPIEWDEREALLKEEYEKNHIKCGEPIPGTLLGAVEGKRLRWKDNNNTDRRPKEGNPALKEAASQFNDALLDEQAKKIARLKKIIRKKNKKIEELRKESSEHLRGRVKMFGETVDLSQELCDKNEELRLTKIREKNLTEVCQKYMKENEELKKELADKVVDKIDAQALKSAESALAWKEKVVTYKDMALAYYEKKITEKDEVIDDLGKELEATKKELEEKTKLVDIIRNASKDYCDYGVAANEFIKKLANLYVIAGNEGTISNEMFERCKNYQTYGFPATCNKETKKEINDIARGKESKKPRIPAPEEPKYDSSSEEFISKAIDNYNRRAANFGWIGSKDGNGIIDQMIGADIAEEGADQSATIVQCGNGITLSKEEAEIIERCTKNGTELHYSEKDGFTYTNVFDEEMPIRCLRGMFHVFTDEEIRNLKK